MAELEIDSRAFDADLVVLCNAAPATATVRTSGKPEDYWAVLEGGSTPGGSPWPSPGPRTIYGQDGRIFSRQAPEGWVRKYGQVYLGYLTDEYLASPTDTQRAVNQAAVRTLSHLQDTVPVDSGALRASLHTEEG